MRDTASQTSPPPLSDPLAGGLPRRRQWQIVLFFAVIGAAAIGLVWRDSATLAATGKERGPIETGAVFRPTPDQLTTFRVAPVGLIDFRSELVTEGKIALNGDKTTPVFSPYSGRVIKVLANPGDHVKQGQPLVALEATEFIQGQNDLVTAANALNSARAQLNLAETNEKRKHGLYDVKGGSLQDWQQSQSDLVAARNNVLSAEAALTAARNRLRVQGRNAAEIARLEAAGELGAEAFVAAPISGTVIDRQVGPGQYVQAAAANPIYTIGDLSTVWLVGNVREPDTPWVRQGQPIEVRVLAFPDRVFKARLAYIAPGVDPNTRRLAVRAEVENPGGILKPEMFAKFSIAAADASSAPAVPESAVVYEGDTARVWTLAGDGAVVARQVRVGRTSQAMVEVLSGLNPGDKVVTAGTLFIDRAAFHD
jgi:cobalt-zinc-cadmium efflux system membrane fusion protein